MITNIRLALFQMDTIDLGLNCNLEKIENLVENIHSEIDILVLPEMFNVGYVLDTKLLSDTFQTVTCDRLWDLCLKHKICIAGSIPYLKEGKWYNSTIIITQEGINVVYNKIHLFGLAGENLNYEKGTLVSNFNHLGWKIQPLICYDLRFPYVVNTQEHPDLILYSAQWPYQRINHWKALLKARAIEHQCYVVGVNRFGTDPNGIHYSGHSLVYNHLGEEIVHPMEGETFEVCTLNLDDVMVYKQKFPFLEDWLDRI